jgi:hypothetical protein
LLISQIEQTFCKLAKPDIDQLKAAILSLGPHLSEVKNYKTEPEQLPMAEMCCFVRMNWKSS